MVTFCSEFHAMNLPKTTMLYFKLEIKKSLPLQGTHHLLKRKIIRLAHMFQNTIITLEEQYLEMLVVAFAAKFS
jgi:hypothetical protein